MFESIDMYVYIRLKNRSDRVTFYLQHSNITLNEVQKQRTEVGSWMTSDTISEET